MAPPLRRNHVVLIPTKDRPESFARTLASVADQAQRHKNHGTHFRVVVLDTSEQAAKAKQNQAWCDKVTKQGVNVHYYTRETAEPILAQLRPRHPYVDDFVSPEAGFAGFRNLLSLLGYRHARSDEDAVTWLDDDTPLAHLEKTPRGLAFKPLKPNYFSRVERGLQTHDVLSGPTHYSGDAPHLTRLNDALEELEKQLREKNAAAANAILRDLASGTTPERLLRSDQPASAPGPQLIRAPNRSHPARILAELPYTESTDEDFNWGARARGARLRIKKHALSIPHVAGRAVSSWNLNASFAASAARQLRALDAPTLPPETRSLLAHAVAYFKNVRTPEPREHSIPRPERWGHVLQTVRFLRS